MNTPHGSSTHRYSGITLIEMVLTLTLVSMIIVFTLRVYVNYEREVDREGLIYNVDVMFQGMRDYFLTVCRNGTYDSTGTFTPTMVLNPTIKQPVPVTLSTLMNAGVLKTQLLKPMNSLVDASGDTTSTSFSAYVMQFNLQPSPNLETMNVCNNGVAAKCSPATQVPAVTNTAVPIWTLQVAVKLLPPKGYKGQQLTTWLNDIAQETGAQCLSSLTGGVVTPCVTSMGSGTYAVWQRIVSTASPYSQSPLWQSTPLLKQFNLQYTHDQMQELINPTSTQANYYYCGG